MKEQGRRHPRSQSAMEYLMTYGWAILIIAVVLGALYSLGVFNAVNFMPKVPGGGCHVFRPNGPGTSWNVNLVGSCNNALPQYVAQFNGQSSYVNAGNAAMLQGQNFASITLEAWVYLTANDVNGGRHDIIDQYTTPASYELRINANAINLILTGLSGLNPPAYPVTGSMLNSWHQIIGTWDGSNSRIYVDGTLVSGPSAQTGTMTASTNPLLFGAFESYYYMFNGSIANVQMYNTSLTANQVAYLYSEGIGGVPISPQYLVGWWPLNGDTNDYSGNNNNGAATAVTFNGTWTSGYNVP